MVRCVSLPGRSETSGSPCSGHIKGGLRPAERKEDAMRKSFKIGLIVTLGMAGVVLMYGGGQAGPMFLRDR